jgi:ADP-heptose:LPS heptosyltransferase
LQALGDTLITLPYLNALRRALPGCRLDFLTRKEVGEIPRSTVLFDRVFEIGGGRSTSLQILAAISLLPRLLRRRYEVVLDLQRNPISRIVRSTLAPLAWSEFDRFSPLSAGERTRLTIEAAGLGPIGELPELKLRNPDAGRDKLLAAGWQKDHALVLLNPAGALPGRNWPVEHYCQLAQELRRRLPYPVQFLVLGIPKIAPKAARMKQILEHDLIDLVGRTSQEEAFAIIKRCALAISEDGGLMHAAWVLKVPTLGLFGASRWVWARPQGPFADAIVSCREPDGVCMAGWCQAAPPNCLEGTDAQRVLDAALKLLSRSGRL